MEQMSINDEMEKMSLNDLDIQPVEGCISNIPSLTSPPDASTSADSDLVWESFLPSDIQQILSSSSASPSLPTFSSKKDLFLHLCDNPLLIDNGTKTLALEKCSGKKCFMIGAKGLSISWGDTPIYWIWRPHPESRFSEVAELLRVCWLEIHGKMETRLLSPNTKYGAYLVFKFTDSAYGFEHPPVKVSVKLGCAGGDAEEGEVRSVCLKPMKTVQLNPLGRQRPPRIVNRRFPSDTLRSEETMANAPPHRAQVPKERGDGWMEIEMGEFFNERGEDGDVEMSLMEIKSLHWKSGLIIEGIELRPKNNQ